MKPAARVGALNLRLDFGCWGCGGEPHAPGECADVATFTKRKCACTVDDRPAARKEEATA